MIGLPPAGGAARLARLVGEATAKLLVLDGRPVSATEAFRLGLVHRLVPAGEAIGAAVEWARWLAGRPEGALATSKGVVVEGRGLSLRDALLAETAQFVARFTDPGVVERAREVQERYDRGADSYEAFGIPHGDPV